MSIKPLLLNSALICLAIPPAFAQSPAADTETDEIIVTALRAIAPSDVTASLTILERTDLDIRNSPFIADQLRAVPGLGISRSGALGALTQIRIRGAEANHTLVLLDGVEVSDPVTGETDFGLWSELNINRVEIARGEQSVLYGSDAIGGVISLISGGDGLRAAGEYGSFNTFRGHIGFSKHVENAQFGISASGFTTDGVDTAGLDGERDGSDSYSVFVNSGIEFNEDWTLKGLVSYRRSNVQSDPDTNFDGALDNADRDNRTEQWIGGATLTGKTGAVTHIARANIGNIVRDNFAENIFTNRTIGDRFKFSYSPSADIKTQLAEFTLSGLIDWENEDYEREDTNTLFGDPNQIAGFETFGIGGEVRARVQNFALNGSIRFDDNNDQFDNATTWRIGGAYNFGFGGKLRASAGAGIKNPTFTELFGFFPNSFVGNPDLIPEKSESWEIGYDQNLGHIQASITYFDAQLEDEIFTQFNPDFSSSPANRAGRSERSGIEFGVSWALSDRLNLTGAATHIQSENDSAEDEVRVPEWTASAALNWQSLSKDGLRAGVALDFVGSQDDFNFGTFPAQRVTLGSYALVSASAEFPVNPRISLTLRGENLLDEETTDVFGFNGTGAGIFAGFKIR